MTADRYGDAGDDRDARVAYVLGRALSLSDELKSTVQELQTMLQSTNEEGGSDHSE
jgi:hypothetical protein